MMTRVVSAGKRDGVHLNSKPLAKSGYNTNLASEFFVMSTLHRLGFEANLTLGNKKSVDIVVVGGRGVARTVDVKAVSGKFDWPDGGAGDSPRDNHFIVLMSYEGRFDDPMTMPRTWVLPHEQLVSLVRFARPPSKMRYVARRDVVRLSLNENAWHLLSA